MKKYIIFICILVLSIAILSSCSSSKKSEEEWMEEYSLLEDKLAAANSRISRLESALSSIYEYHATVHCYFEDEDVSKKDAHNAITQIHYIFDDLGY